MPYSKTALAGLLLACLASSASAALIDRGGGLLYDTMLDVTWLQDANYAKTSGYDTDGKMNWTDATSWVNNLVYHDSLNNTDYTGWRLPDVKPVNGVAFNYNHSNRGVTDYGHNITSPNSELAYMYYVNLGLSSEFAPSDSGATQTNFGIFGDGFHAVGDHNDVGLVKNLTVGNYWSGVAFPPISGDYWDFSTQFGYQSSFDTAYPFYAWAVHNGDIASSVPLPPTGWLIGASLLVMRLMSNKSRIAKPA